MVRVFKLSEKFFPEVESFVLARCTSKLAESKTGRVGRPVPYRHPGAQRNNVAASANVSGDGRSDNSCRNMSCISRRWT